MSVQNNKIIDDSIKFSADNLTVLCHGASYSAGWWDNVLGNNRRILRDPVNPIEVVIGKLIFSNKLTLIHSEVSEAMEGDRKSLPDDKLPQYPMRVVELADAAIRCFDLAGAVIRPEDGFTFGEVIAAKMAYNATREDHKKEVRDQ